MEVDQQKYYVYYHLYIWCVSCAAVSTIATSVETSFAFRLRRQKNLFDVTCLGWTVDTTRTDLQSKAFVVQHFVSSEGALYVILPYDYQAAAAAATF